MVVGVLLVELVRLLLSKARRERQIAQIRVYGLRRVLWNALTGDPQPELELREPRRYHA